MPTRYYLGSGGPGAPSNHPWSEQSPDVVDPGAFPTDISSPMGLLAAPVGSYVFDTVGITSSATSPSKAVLGDWFVGPQLAAGTYAGGTMNFFWARGEYSYAYTGNTRTRVFIYLWRDSTASVVATLYGPTTDATSGVPGSGTFYITKKTGIPYSGFTAVSGDQIIVEIWLDNVGGIGTSTGLDFAHNGTNPDTTYADDDPVNPPDIASYIEFSETILGVGGSTTHDADAVASGFAITNAGASAEYAISANITGIASIFSADADLLPGPSSNILITPKSGLTLGGDHFTIIGASVSNQQYEDQFLAGSLNLSNWTDISSGGSASTGSGLNLSIPTTGGTAGIRTVATYNNFDVSARFSYDDTIEDLYPSALLTFLRLSARIDATNNFTVAHIWDPNRGSTLLTTVTTNGVTSTLLTNNVKSSNRLLRLVRHGGRIQAYVGNSLLIDYFGWSGAGVKIELSSESPAIPLPLQTIVTQYTPSVLVTFDNDICPAAFSVADRIVGSTPSTKLPSLPEIFIYGIDGFDSLDVGAFQYISPLQLTISRNDDSIVINNDNTLRDTSGDLKGFRL